MDEVREWLIAVAAVVAAVGTVAAFVIAFAQIADERAAREEGERGAASAARQQQAEQVSAWVASDDEDGVRIALSNRSGSPVYQAVSSLVLVQGAGPRRAKGVDYGSIEPAGQQRTLSVIAPGESHITIPPGYAGMGRRPGVEIAFSDRSGRHWLRLATGALREINEHPYAYYALALPLPWELPRPGR